MSENKNRKAPEPRMNEQDLREKVQDSPGYEGNRSQSDLDGEQNRKDEAEGSRHIRDKGHNDSAQRGKVHADTTRNLSGEAQNVNDDSGRPLTEDEASQAKNKAVEGIRQGRDEGSANSNAERMNFRKGK